jgi:hyperosmotically inducible protein
MAQAAKELPEDVHNGAAKSVVLTKMETSSMKLTLLTLSSAAAIAGSAWSEDTNADNTAKNERDRDNRSPTATDQSNDPVDIKLTADIRKMVVKDDSLSMMAKNVKIIAIDGAVTLRGPVENAERKDRDRNACQASRRKKDYQ